MTLSMSSPWYRARLSYVADQSLTAVAAIVGAFAAVYAHAAPTGGGAIDVVLVGVSIKSSGFAPPNVTGKPVNVPVPSFLIV